MELEGKHLILVLLACLGAIVLLEIVALCKSIDGAGMAAAFTAVGVIGGVALQAWRAQMQRRRSRRPE